VEHLQGDRNGDLKSLEGKQWDVVIDNPTTLPRWVRDAAAVLKNSVKQYVFISTISVYSDNSKPHMDESGPLIKLDDPTTEKITGLSYGGLKALSEQEAEKAFPGKALIIRPGLIVGPGDPTDRFTYWPIRIERGGEILSPGDPTDPVQFIDGRDLSEWCIRMIEQGEVGVFNATGPKHELSIAEMLYGIKAVTVSDAKFTWVNADFLEQQKVAPWGDMPVWIPPRGEYLGFAQINIKKSVSKGLTFRPLAETAKETIEWFKTLPAERQAKLLSGIKPERETEVLAAWHSRKKEEPKKS
jgi:2'-hydroxyisoflavone reductase